MGGPKRMDSAAYLLFEGRMRGVWHASVRAGTDERAIEAAALCTPSDAFRIAMVRRAASPALASLWLAGELSFRQLARIVLVDAPALTEEDEREQLELAARHVPRLRSAK